MYQYTQVTGDFDIASSQTISGAGVGLTIVDGGALDRVLDVRPGAAAYLSGVTIRNGNPSSSAGGIINRGILTLASCAVTANAGIDFGGGIYNDMAGALTMTDTTVSDNVLAGANTSGGFSPAGATKSGLCGG